MGGVIGDLLPTALGVAISPVPIIAVILMLLAPRAKAASVGFMVGWVAGIAVVITLVALLVDPVEDSDTSEPSTVTSVLLLVLGVAACLLAVRSWRGRPRAGQTPELPKWMAAIDSMTPVKAVGLGALLSGGNPKNLTLGLAGGLTIGSGGLDSKETVVAIVVFVVIASSTVALPVLAYLAAQDRVRQPLDDLRVWLTQNNSTVMAVLLLVIGVTILGKGLAGIL
jgi:threonine/homoserine/homoserine lactone efflux protein